VKIYADFSAYSDIAIGRRGCLASKFPKILIGILSDKHYGLLASLAHFAYELVDGLRVHTLGDRAFRFLVFT